MPKEVTLNDLTDDFTFDPPKDEQVDDSSERDQETDTEEQEEEEEQEEQETRDDESEEQESDEEQEDNDEEQDIFEFLNESFGFLPEGIENTEDVPTALKDYISSYSKDQTNKAFDDWQKANPRAAAYALHLSQGGADEDFFVSPKDQNLLSLELSEDNDLVNKSVVKQGYLDQGIDEETALRLIEMDEEAGKIFDKAKGFQEKAIATHQAAQKEAETKAIERNTRNTQIVGEFSDAFQELLSSKKIGNFNIKNDEEALAFAKFFKDNISFDQQEGKFYTKQSIDTKNMKGVLESVFFAFKGGDLSNYVKSVANTKRVKGLGRKVTKAPKGGSSGGGSNVLTLNDITL